jgi:hypothetical protein
MKITREGKWKIYHFGKNTTLAFDRPTPQVFLLLFKFLLALSIPATLLYALYLVFKYLVTLVFFS